MRWVEVILVVVVAIVLIVVLVVVAVVIVAVTVVVAAVVVIFQFADQHVEAQSDTSEVTQLVSHGWVI